MKEPASTEYDIRLRTPVGIRLGHMTVRRQRNTVSGSLNILKHTEPFEGTIDTEGNCKLFGKMITLIRTVSYEAVGTITPDSLMLSIVDGRHVLNITGTVCQS